MRILRRSVLLATTAGALAWVLPRRAHALSAPADLLARLATHAAGFERMKTHTSYALSGRMEELGSDGATKATKEMDARVVSDGLATRFEVLRYVEDGADQTAEAQRKAKESAAKKKESKRRDLRMPFHSGEQARYDFDAIETDPADATRVRIAFTPKIREEDTVEGSAWVDTAPGTVLSAGFKLSQPPSPIDYVHGQLTFGAPTSLGPAVSRLEFEGAGGVLFLRKHVRGVVTLSGHAIVP